MRVALAEDSGSLSRRMLLFRRLLTSIRDSSATDLLLSSVLKGPFFSRVVVGGSHYTGEFLRVYGERFWTGKRSRQPRDVKDYVRLRFVRNAANAHDYRAVEAWVRQRNSSTYWLAGHLNRRVARVVSPLADESGIREWEQAGMLRGQLRLRDPFFGIVLQPSVRFTPGPDLAYLRLDPRHTARRATAGQVEYLMRLVYEMTPSDRRTFLAEAGLPDRDRFVARANRLDIHQLSVLLASAEGTLDLP